MKLRFSKMHGAGNDYIYVDCFDQTVENPNELSKRLSDRHFGIGGDGLVLIMPSAEADCRMRMFNADGSEGRMCGNAVRCVGKYVYDRGIARKEVVSVETLSGVKTLRMFAENGVAVAAEVDMGEPAFESGRIPVLVDSPDCLGRDMDIAGGRYRVYCVSMGNPHAVVFVDDVEKTRVESVGPLFEKDPRFPEGVNTEFVQRVDERTLKMRVWERGSGETLACGTGASASAVAAAVAGLCPRGEDIKVILRGGVLFIRWSENGRVYMRGPAEHVFDGEIEV